MTWAYVFFFMVVIVLFEAYALYSIQRYAISKQPRDAIVCCLIYGLLVPFLLYRLLSYKGVGIANFIWNVFSTIIGFLIGVLLFQERVENLQWLGVALAMVALGMICV